MSEASPVALLVEDEPQIRRFVRMALDGEGWQIFEAETMKRGLIDAGTRKPNLIILDLIHLTPTEYRLLAVRVKNVGRVVTNPQLLREVWGPSNSENGHYLRIYMGHLRQKLEQDAAQPKYLLTETAVGYRLLLPT